MKEENLRALTDLIKTVHFLLKHQLPYTTIYQPLTTLLKDIDHSNFLQTWTNRLLTNTTYTSTLIATEFVKTLLVLVKSNIKVLITIEQAFLL